MLKLSDMLQPAPADTKSSTVYKKKPPWIEPCGTPFESGGKKLINSYSFTPIRQLMYDGLHQKHASAPPAP